MIDFVRLRRNMVDSQVRVNDVTEPRLIAAMLELPRERFVPADRRSLAYIDDDVAVNDAGAAGPPRFLLEPMILAKLLQALEVRETDRVLDVGGATGYSAALLSRLAAQVVAVEEDAALAAEARRNLGELGVSNVHIVGGALAGGAPDQGPFDVILINGAVEQVPEALTQQLKEAGRLGAILRRSPPGRATLFWRTNGSVSSRPLFDAAVPQLPGFEAPRGFVF